MTEPATEDTKTCESAEKAEASTAEKQETKDPSDDKEEHTNQPGMSTDTQFSMLWGTFLINAFVLQFLILGCSIIRF